MYKHILLFLLILCYSCNTKQNDHSVGKSLAEKRDSTEYALALRCVDSIPFEYKINVYALYYFTTLYRNLILAHNVFDSNYVDDYGCPDTILFKDNVSLLIYRRSIRTYRDCLNKRVIDSIFHSNFSDDRSGMILNDFVYVFDVTNGTPKRYDERNWCISKTFSGLFDDSIYSKK